MKHYFVKTRNWNGQRWVCNLLRLVTFLYGGRSWENVSNPYDRKFTFEGDKRKAYALYNLYMKLVPYSEGWTYIDPPTTQQNEVTL